MSRIGLSALAASCVFATLSVAPTITADSARAGSGVRLLLTGDSITHGRHGDYTWRYRLAEEFRRQGVPFDFVGSESTPYQDPGFPQSKYADPNFDRDHFARAGWQLRQMVGEIRAEVAKQRPDVIVLAAGVNDLLRGQSVDELEESLRSWVREARAGRYDIRIVLSPVLAANPSKSRRDINLPAAEYNLRLPQIARELSTVFSPVTVATTDQGWSPAAPNTTDGLHPTPTGETFIAQRIGEALHRAGVLPGAPTGGARTVPWPYAQRPAVAVAGRTATVRWSSQAVTGAHVRVRQVGGTVLAPATEYRSGVATFTLKRGVSYDISIRLNRVSMAGPWGEPTRVTVPGVPSPPGRGTITHTAVRWKASPDADAYVVQFRKASDPHWVKRRTDAPKLRVKDVVEAKVRTVSTAGRSVWRQISR